MAALVRHDRDLEKVGRLTLQIVFRVDDPGTRRHDLNVARFGAPLIAQIVAIGDRAAQDIGNDLYIAVRMGIEAHPGRDPVVVPHAQRPHAHAVRIVIIRKAKMISRVEPIVLEPTQRLEGDDIDRHRQRYFSRMLAISFNWVRALSR